ncbi:MAG TPA: MFS transporter, partial [Jatrophihabitantaceae bacterium]|nr:MFS transporter [Jatrophihabitantaceae bacterium]
MADTADTDLRRSPAPVKQTGARRHAHPALILLVIAGAQMMVVLDGTIVNIALPSMGRYFNKSQTDMTWALNAYALAFGGLLLLGGRMGDILGRRRMFILGLSLFTLGSFLAGIAPSFGLLLAGRAVQGVGGAIASPTALSLITTEFEEGEARTRAIAVYAAVSGAGAALGLLLGGILTNYLSWRWVLFVNVPIGIVLMGGAALYLHESERLRGKFDFIGAALSVAGLVATVYGFIHVAHDGWNNTQTYAVFTAAVVLLVGFVYFEARIAKAPMMPMRIFENRNRAGTYLIMLVVGAAMFGMFYFITFFVQGVREYGPLKTGFAFLPVAFVIGIVSQINARLMPKFGPKPLMITGTTLLTVALFWFATVTKDASYAGKLLPGMFILAVAMGFLFVPLTVTAVSNVANTDAGLASALLNVGQQVGGA